MLPHAAYPACPRNDASHTGSAPAQPSPALLLKLQLKELGTQQCHGALAVPPLRPLLLQASMQQGRARQNRSARAPARRAICSLWRHKHFPHLTQREPYKAAAANRRYRPLSSRRPPAHGGARLCGMTRLAEDADASGLVREVDSRLHLVHILPTCAARPRRGQLNILQRGDREGTGRKGRR